MQDEAAQIRLIFLLNEVAWLMRRTFQEDARPLKMTQAQARALAVICRREGLTQTQLAERLDVGPMAVVRLVDRMQRAGLVRREQDPSDRRALRLYLANHGKPVQQKLATLSGKIGDRAIAGMSAADEAKLVELLHVIKSNFGGVNEAPPR